MNFSSWLMNEEIYLQNRTATVYHRTKNIKIVEEKKDDNRLILSKNDINELLEDF